MILCKLGLVLHSGLRYFFIIFGWCCGFQELSFSLKSFDLFPGAKLFSLPREVRSLTGHFLGIGCFKLGRGVDLHVLFLNWGGGGLSTLIPFKLWITEHACNILPDTHTGKHRRWCRLPDISDSVWRRGSYFWSLSEGQMLLSRNDCISLVCAFLGLNARRKKHRVFSLRLYK